MVNPSGGRRFGSPGLLALAVCLLGVATASADGDAHGRDGSGQVETGLAVDVEHPQALRGFRAALGALHRGTRRRVRVLHYGDSNVAANLWTRVTRRRLQDRFGDGGDGYLVAAPWGSWLRGHTRIRGGEQWEPRRYGGRRFGPRDGQWGLAGVALEGTSASSTLRVELANADVQRTVALEALGSPRGGTLRVRVDGGEPQWFLTRRATRGLVRHELTLGPGAHNIDLRMISGRRVRLLGIDVLRQDRGVVYDVLGINGHRASAMQTWDRHLLSTQMSARTPDLVVLSYGANEALDPNLAMHTYRAQLARSLSLVRELSPNASCLVVAPVAMCDQPRNAEVIRIQQELAPDHGCAFWNTSEVSGGTGSLCAWIRRGLVHTDDLHLTQTGYEVVGARFTDALVAGL